MMNTKIRLERQLEEHQEQSDSQSGQQQVRSRVSDGQDEDEQVTCMFYIQYCSRFRVSLSKQLMQCDTKAKVRE